MANCAAYTSFCFLFCSVVGVFASYDVCSTSEGKFGKCVIINECPPLLNLLKKRPIPTEHHERLRQANCGFQGIRPKVCCSLDAVLEITQQPPIWSEIPPTGSTHGPHVSSTELPVVSSTEQQAPSSTEQSITSSTEQTVSSLSEQSVPSSTEQPVSETPLSNLLPNLQECGYFIDDLVLLGAETQLDGHPWMVLLQYETPSGPGHHCGGVLINKRYVLTAAHCISGTGIDPLTWKLVGVRLGEYDRDTDPDCNNSLFALDDCCCTDPVVDVGIEKVIMHEEYHAKDPQRYHDIALLRLKEDVTFSDFIRPICLQPSFYLRNTSRSGNPAVIGGWGVNTLRSESRKKQTAAMQIRDNADCEAAYAKKGLKLREDQICAIASKGKNPCSGDSGGAIMNNVNRANAPVNYYALGIASIAYPICGLSEYPVIYTRVESYLPWIINNLDP